MKTIRHRLLISALTCLLLLMMSEGIGAVVIPIYLTKNHQSIGTITAKDSKYGLLLLPHLHGLPPGFYGLHIHEKASCADHGNAAGGHLDPKKTGKHLGPYNDKGHLGDLPVLIVDKQGKASTPLLAPRLTVKAIRHHAIMIHAGGDNYADEPKKLGGGGHRQACGVIK